MHYIYALDGSLLAEADGTTGQVQREYVWLPAEETSLPLPLALITGVNTATPSLMMVHADHLGRPIRLTDASRATVWQASYRPFGEVDSILGKLEQNLRFPGQYFLMETGLAYNWHRFYDPATGRYTQPDPLRFVDGPSVYRYVAASPLLSSDRGGLAIGDNPPPPPGYDPNTWPQRQFPNNGKPYLADPEGKKWIPHPEDGSHWRHWDKQGPGGDDQGRWPPNSKKPWPNQKRPPQPDQCSSDPNGDAPPWIPDENPLVPVYPIPSPNTPIPGLPEIPFVPEIFVIP